MPATPNPLAGKRGLWLRQYSDTSEQTTEAIIHRMMEYGFDFLALKCGDGVTWQGEIDPSMPLRSTGELLDLANTFASHDLQLVPVHVPRGRAISSEADFAAALADVVGAVIVDLEVGEGFWGAPTSLIVNYWARLRQKTQGWVFSQPDPRPEHWATARHAQSLPYIDGLVPQLYAGFDGGWTAESAVEQFYNMVALGKPVGVTLWGMGNLDVAADFWTRVNRDAFGYHVFAMGAMDARQLRWAAERPLWAAEPPPPNNEEEWLLRSGLAKYAASLTIAVLEGDYVTARALAMDAVRTIDAAGGVV